MAAKQNAKNQVNRLEDYRPCPYTITHADLTFRLDARDTRVTSTICVVRGKDSEPGTPLVLDGDGLALVSGWYSARLLQRSRQRFLCGG